MAMEKMKIRDGFVLRQVMGKSMVVAVGQRSREFNCIIRLNEVAADLWTWLTEGATKETLVARLQEKYDIHENTAMQDVDNFVFALHKEGLLEYESTADR